MSRSALDTLLSARDEQVGDCDDSCVVSFGVFTDFIHNRSDPFVREIDAMESIKSTNVVGTTKESMKRTRAILLERKCSIDDILDLTGDMDVVCLCESLDPFVGRESWFPEIINTGAILPSSMRYS